MKLGASEGLLFLIEGVGWARFIITTPDGQQANVPTSYLSDVPGDLTLAALSLEQDVVRVAVPLLQEPGEHVLLVEPEANQERILLVDISDTDLLIVDVDEGADPVAAGGRVLVDERVERGWFAREVKRVVSSLDRSEVDGQLEVRYWHSPFPLDPLWQLAAA